MFYRIVSIHASTITQKMQPGKTLTGEMPDVDPVIGRGTVGYDCVENGGIFWFGEDVVVEQLSSGTWKIIDHLKNVVRDTPQTPFKINGGEGLSITGEKKAICVARLDMMQVV